MGGDNKMLMMMMMSGGMGAQEERHVRHHDVDDDERPRRYGQHELHAPTSPHEGRRSRRYGRHEPTLDDEPPRVNLTCLKQTNLPTNLISFCLISTSVQPVLAGDNTFNACFQTPSWVDNNASTPLL